MGIEWTQDDWVAILEAGGRAIRSPETVHPPSPIPRAGFALRVWVAPSFAAGHGLLVRYPGWLRPEAQQGMVLRVVTWDQPADVRRLDPGTGATSTRQPTLLLHDERLDPSPRLCTLLATAERLAFRLGPPPEFSMLDGTEAGVRLDHDGTRLEMAWRWRNSRTERAQSWCRRVLTDLAVVTPAVHPMLASWREHVD